jgi:hypothetical protein
MTLPTFGNTGEKLKGGDTVKVPYFDAIGELDDVTEGNALTPVALAQTSETASVIHSGKAGEITNWAQLTAMFSDPYAEYAKQFAAATMRRIDKNLITAAGTTTLSNDISGNAGAAAQINYDAMVDAKMKWADEQDASEVSLFVCHSKVFGDMLKLKDSTGRPLVVMNAADGELPRFVGMPVAVSDRVTTSGSGASTIYTNLLCKKAALAAWVNGAPEVLEDRDILTNSKVTAVHTYHVAHLYKRPNGGQGTKPGVVKLLCKAST